MTADTSLLRSRPDTVGLAECPDCGTDAWGVAAAQVAALHPPIAR